jgi:hypothetical protein
MATLSDYGSGHGAYRFAQDKRSRFFRSGDSVIRAVPCPHRREATEAAAVVTVKPRDRGSHRPVASGRHTGQICATSHHVGYNHTMSFLLKIVVEGSDQTLEYERPNGSPLPPERGNIRLHIGNAEKATPMFIIERQLYLHPETKLIHTVTLKVRPTSDPLEPL